MSFNEMLDINYYLNGNNDGFPLSEAKDEEERTIQ
jgi:hypothetical protein